VAESTDPPISLTKRFARWLLEAQAVESKGRVAKEGQPEQGARETEKATKGEKS
jgi:hypothetical protein